MAINFPDSPSLNDSHVSGGRRWKWNGTVWERIPASGAQGVQGADGNFGGATFDYTFKTATSDTNPGSGNIRLNNSNLSSATLLYIHDSDGGGTDIQAFLRTIDDSTSTIKGHVRISNRLNADDFTLFTIGGTNTEVSGYHKVTVAYVSGATSFSNNEDIIVTFARTAVSYTHLTLPTTPYV